MDSSWIAFFVIWAVVEFIQFLRKKTFAQRMKVAAGWSMVLVSLIFVGQSSSATNPLAMLGISLLLTGGVALMFYWLRIALAKCWFRIFSKRVTPPA